MSQMCWKTKGSFMDSGQNDSYGLILAFAGPSNALFQEPLVVLLGVNHAFNGDPISSGTVENKIIFKAGDPSKSNIRELARKRVTGRSHMWHLDQIQE
jgi:hypothetical protein